jgi:hypothetical protein
MKRRLSCISNSGSVLDVDQVLVRAGAFLVDARRLQQPASPVPVRDRRSEYEQAAGLEQVEAGLEARHVLDHLEGDDHVVRFRHEPQGAPVENTADDIGRRLQIEPGVPGVSGGPQSATDRPVATADFENACILRDTGQQHLGAPAARILAEQCHGRPYSRTRYTRTGSPTATLRAG